MPSHENGVASGHANGTSSTLKDPRIPHLAHNKSSWTDPGPAAFDFRSDVLTTPTASMLNAIKHTSLLDDVFREDTATNNLQSYIAELTGHEAALLVMSGTMGNQLSIRTHLTQPPQSVLADASSHIMNWEAGGLAFLSNAMAYPIKPQNAHHLTLADIKSNAILSKDIHFCPTALICLENTLAGTILPLAECQQISTWAHAQSPRIKLHCDGARLWEAVAAGAGSLQAYCACFDSVSLCFSKGLGAPIGSIIVGSEPFIERARHLRKPLGGGLRQAGVISAPARVAVEETFLAGRLAATHARAQTIAAMWLSRGGWLQRECETNMVWFDLEAAGVDKERFVELGVAEGVSMLGGRLVVHYQIGDEAVERLARVMDAVLVGKGGEGEGASLAEVLVDCDTKQGVKRKAEEVMAPENEYGA